MKLSEPVEAYKRALCGLGGLVVVHLTSSPLLPWQRCFSFYGCLVGVPRLSLYTGSHPRALYETMLAGSPQRRV